MPEFKNKNMPYHGVTPHLVPFLPYIEKTDDSPLDEKWRPANSLSRPINVSTIEGWLKECDGNHWCRQRNPNQSKEGQRPAWVVDIERKCIVRYDGGEYVALSYVWGQHYDSSACLAKDNLERLRQPGALDGVALPKTITDAARLVEELGVEYLWVDRLCIVQDDHGEKERQLLAMAGIYERAYFTLIAAQSPDASGPMSSRPLKRVGMSWWESLLTLAGVGAAGKAKEERDMPWRRPANNREVMNLHSIDLLRTVWFQRGWTFQEYLFSGRRVVFHNNTVNRECRCASLHEHQLRLRSTASMPTLRVSQLDSWPNFHRFARLSALFAPRYFTYSEDVHDAFAGAGNHFAATFPGGLISGLPGGSFFDAALLWQPYSPMERRVASQKIQKGEEVLPSWSWLTFRGNVQSESWAAGWSYFVASQQEGGWQVIPTVKWKHSETEQSPRHLASAPETVTQTESKDWKESDGCYTHPSIPDLEFTRPIPFRPTRQPYKAIAHRSRYLHCKTWHCTWRLDQKAYHAFAGNCAILALLDQSGNLAGHLRVNVPQSHIRNKIPTDPIDLIELSRGQVELQPQSPESAQMEKEERLDMLQRDLSFPFPVPLMKELKAPKGEERDLVLHPLADVFDEWSLPLWPTTRNKGLYEFYNVMWVKWLDEDKTVAERVAVGRIQKGAWEGRDKAVRQTMIA
ncbi:heterokaryon incompatibility protein-domain-containing protein [Triangularia setosa]|uniref:Heterokaryon incompatibility protein-domain-containing protein n=1 Tax=Triangularia setosa TaxID=2587417 RepID=A0AAN7A994_9PEZI|nr:heterokaryon incompatibility protein-domain-containing protein [Podospora setosa]